ncbi:MAG: aspartate carbamoyltransferase catalytic subunit [Persicimonas sp.]
MDLIGLKDLSAEQLRELVDLSESFVGDEGQVITPEQYRGALDGRSVALVFFEPSTRTRVSFELAAHKLGAFSVRIGSDESSIKKGETVLDTCRNLEAMGIDGLIVRHNERHLPFAVKDRIQIPFINAGNGSGEHPTQALIDVVTLRRAFRRRGEALEGKRVAIIGDVVHSRVARSDVHALSKLGCKVVLAGPSMMLPKSGDTAWGAEVASSRDEALDGADAVIMLRVQQERIHGELVDTHTYVREWGIDEQVAQEVLGEDTFVLHPGPVIRGMELTATVADSPNSLILEQVGYGAAVRQAVLLKCLQDQ